MNDEYCKQLEEENERLKKLLASHTVLEGVNVEVIEQTTEDIGISQLEIIQITKDIISLDQTRIDTEGGYQ